MTSWFYVTSEVLNSNPVYLDGDNLRHLKALRMKKGDALVLSDGMGRAVQSLLEALESERAAVRLQSELESCSEPGISLRLFLGITKGDKMDMVVRQAVELGCSEIIPVVTKRTVVMASPSKWEKRADRWRSIALSAAAQSRRCVIPKVLNPLLFNDMLPLLGQDSLVIVPWEEEKAISLGMLLRQYEHPPDSVSIFTGPEGGICREEIDRLRKLPTVHPVSLGPRILRAETAPIAVLSVIMGFWGDMGSLKEMNRR